MSLARARCVDEWSEEVAAADSRWGRRKEEKLGSVFRVWPDSSILPLGSDVISFDWEELEFPKNIWVSEQHRSRPLRWSVMSRAMVRLNQNHKTHTHTQKHSRQHLNSHILWCICQKVLKWNFNMRNDPDSDSDQSLVFVACVCYWQKKKRGFYSWKLFKRRQRFDSGGAGSPRVSVWGESAVSPVGGEVALWGETCPGTAAIPLCFFVFLQAI